MDGTDSRYCIVAGKGSGDIEHPFANTVLVLAVTCTPADTVLALTVLSTLLPTVLVLVGTKHSSDKRVSTGGIENSSANTVLVPAVLRILLLTQR